MEIKTLRSVKNVLQISEMGFLAIFLPFETSAALEMRRLFYNRENFFRYLVSRQSLKSPNGS